ncbi:MAG: zincin-like metallopeptidase domain-containing protein [Deltaproteobacteria bacterium]|nr:zincin-like metallopeptidase domain-containing protein [Deltaproteobacteria bacterium]
MSVYEKITEKILEQLEQGTVPWRKPWHTSLPKNLVSRKPYRGINVLMLGMQGYASAYWATFRQVAKLGGTVRKDEHGTLVVFTSRFEVVDKETGEEKEIPFLKSYVVFNLAQTSGISTPAEEQKAPVSPIAKCEEVVTGMADKPSIDFDGGSRAYYSPLSDSIHLPAQAKFESAEGYYGTLFHELVHSTGNAKRLARKGVAQVSGFGSESYCQEELVAEIGAAFLCGTTGIETRTLENSASYIAGWLKSLKDDKKLVVVAAAQAQRAVDYICGEPTSTCHSVSDLVVPVINLERNK